jgi:hypothetical protein
VYGSDVASPQSSVPVSGSPPGSEAPNVSVTAPLEGTASGPLIVAAGATLRTVTVEAYSRRPPSRSMIAPVTWIVAGPCGAGTTRLAPPGANAPPSTDHWYVKPAAVSPAYPPGW